MNNNKQQAIDETEQAKKAEQAERAAIDRRREFLRDQDHSSDAIKWPRVGLALSGGGIRSATFCLGVLRGLAQNSVLRRFDYLSTVSGGGYIGAALGRLYERLGSASKVEKELEQHDSASLKWLRYNGRYLTPSGTKSWGILIAGYLRSWLAIQGEFFVLATLLCAIVILPHLLVLPFTQVLPTDAHNVLEQLSPSPWLGLALVVLALAVPLQLVGYWLAPPSISSGSISLGEQIRQVALAAIIALGAAALLYWLGQPFFYSIYNIDNLANFYKLLAAAVPSTPQLAAYTVVLFGAFGVLIAAVSMLVRYFMLRSDSQIALFRDARTKGLRTVLVSALVLALCGVLDRGGWELWRYLEEHPKFNLTSILGVSIIVLSTLRAAMESYGHQQVPTQESFIRRFGALLVNLAGGLAVAISLLLCSAALQWLVFGSNSPRLAFADTGMSSIAWIKWLAIVSVALLWIIITGHSATWANNASLHAFYRSRLARAYLGVGNRERQEAATKRVDDVMPGDDVMLKDYHPESAGGPLHLINLCLNETADSMRHGANIDRKARPVTLSNCLVEVSNQARLFDPNAHGGSLAQWVAVSGAAASSGAGAHTTRGWAVLMYLFGARLGFWAPQFKTHEPNTQSSLLWKCLPKPMMQWAELTATYDTAAPYCLLSDGGHFENTGVYPLIRRKLPFIVLVDCGADPKYGFDDLQELVRRARIDHGAEITFYTQTQATALFPPPQKGRLCVRVLLPREMADNTSARGVMLARIRYADGSFGTLLVIKPNLHEALPLDVQSYVREHSAFPQQPTADQFFDEAQWESYQRLGFDIGSRLTNEWLATLPNWEANPAITHPKDALDPVPLEASSQANPASPSNWRAVSGSAVGAGVGMGAVLAVMVPFLQTFSEYQNKQDKAADEYANELLAPVRDYWEQSDYGNIKPTRKLSSSEVNKLKKAVDDKLLPTKYHDEAVNLINRLRSICENKDKDSEYRYCDSLRMEEGNVSKRIEYWVGVVNGSKDQGEKPSSGEKEITNAQPPNLEAEAPGDAAGIKEKPSSVEKENMIIDPKFIRHIRQACTSAGISVRLFPQVYDNCSLLKVAAFRKEVGQGVNVQATENVVISARRAGRREPYRWTRPTFIVHDPAQNECAEKLVDAYNKLNSAKIKGFETVAQSKPLPTIFKSTPGMIELWLPEDKACMEK